MKYKKLFLIVFFLSIISTVKGAVDVNMCVPKPHLIGGRAGESVLVSVRDVMYVDGPQSDLFTVHRGKGEYDIDKDSFDAPFDVKWEVQRGRKFVLLDDDANALHSWKLRAFATCQIAGTMWEGYCDSLLATYDAQQLSPIFGPSLSQARAEALESPVQIFCSSGCYDDLCSFNAYYTRDYKGFGRGIFLPRYATSCGSSHTSGSFFTIAHEAGHSILDRLCPGYQDRIESPKTAQKEELSYQALHEGFGDITGILASLSVVKDPSNLIKTLDLDTCFVEIECQGGCVRGPDTQIDNPLDFHGYSLNLTRKFCRLLKAENKRLRNGRSAMQSSAERFLDLVLQVGYGKERDPFQTILAGL